MAWIDTHCHLDAPEFARDPDGLRRARASAAARGVALCVLPAVAAAHFAGVRALAYELGDAYALGIHPLCVPEADEADLARLDQALGRHAGDPRLVAVGEIGLDLFVPALQQSPLRDKQLHFFQAQLRLARQHCLPVIVHSRRSVDLVHKHLRALAPPGGIAHAFNGSLQQAQALCSLGLRLGFGGASTFDTARHLRRLATELPLDALVMETDAPDIPPQWLYVPQAARAAGRPQGVNTPAELPRIGAELAALRGISAEALADATTRNAIAALPRLAALLQARPVN